MAQLLGWIGLGWVGFEWAGSGRLHQLGKTKPKWGRSDRNAHLAPK